MPAEFYHAGSHVDYTPGSDYTAGTPVNLGSDTWGIGANDIDANIKGSLAIGGVYKIPKIAATALAIGDTVGYDISADEVVTSVSGDSDGDIGVIVYAAASADAYCYVLLNGRNI